MKFTLCPEINPKKMGVLSEGEREITMFSNDYAQNDNEQQVLETVRENEPEQNVSDDEQVSIGQVVDKKLSTGTGNQEKINLESTMEPTNAQEPKSGAVVQIPVSSNSDDGDDEDVEDQLVNNLKKIELDTTENNDVVTQKTQESNVVAPTRLKMSGNDEVPTEVCAEKSQNTTHKKVQERAADYDEDVDNDHDSSDEESEEENTANNFNIIASELTNDLQKLAIAEKDKNEDEGVISRAPMKGHDYIPRPEPYPAQSNRSHYYHQSGGYVTATFSQIEVPGLLVNENASFNNLHSPESNLVQSLSQSPLDDLDIGLPLSPILDQRHYLSDDCERDLFDDLFNTGSASRAELASNVSSDTQVQHHCTNIEDTLLLDQLFTSENLGTFPDKVNNNMMTSYQNPEQSIQQSSIFQAMSPLQVVPSMPYSPTQSDVSESPVPSPYMNNLAKETLSLISNIQGIVDVPPTSTVASNNMNISVNSSYENTQQFSTPTNINYQVTTPKEVAPSTVTIPYSPAQSESSSSSSPPYREYSSAFSTDTSSSSSSDVSSNCSSPYSFYPGSPDVSVNLPLLSMDLFNQLVNAAPMNPITNYSQNYTQTTTTATASTSVNTNTRQQVPTGRNTSFLKPTGCPVIEMPQGPGLEPKTAKERMKLDPKKKLDALGALALLSPEQLSAGDEDLDTKLMIMIARKLPNGYEYLYALVHRLEKIPGALAARNKQNQSALLLACLYMPDQPLVARFIAEALQNVNYDFNEVYEDGNTIIHQLCKRGDKYVDVLAELISMRHANGQPCFDINRHNHSEGTPLLVAVKAHGSSINCSRTIINCSRTIEFLMRQGASVTETERCGGMSALHIAIRESADPLIVTMLLKAASRNNQNLVNRLDYQKDTALHYAHLRNDINVQQQLKIITLLEQYGAVRVNGSQGKMPLTLVTPPERKEYIRANSFRRGRRS